MSLLAAAGVSALGSLIGGKMAGDAASRAAQASLFRPVDITTGIGTVTATGRPGDVDFTTQLSPELQAVRGQLLGVGTQALGQFQTFDPLAAGQLFEQQLTALAAPQEEQARLQQESRLFKQGLLGATTGAQQVEALRSAQALAANERRLQGLLQGQTQQERLFQSALGGIQGATALDAMLGQQLNQAIAAGGAQTLANTNAAEFNFKAGQTNAAMMSNFFGGLGRRLMDMSDGSPPPAAPYSYSVPYAPAAPLFGSTPLPQTFGGGIASTAMTGGYL